MLKDVYLRRTYISYGTLERRGFALVYDGEKRALAWHRDGAIAFDVVMHSNVLYVDVIATEESHGAGEHIMAALESGATTDVIWHAKLAAVARDEQRRSRRHSA